MPLPIRFVVVSWPATNSSTTVERSSSSESLSPSSSAASSAVEEVVARVGPTLLEDAVEVVDERHEGEEPALDRGVVESPSSIRDASALHGPKRCWSSGGHAEQLADHRHRQRVADGRDQVEARRVGVVEHAATSSATCGRSCSTVRGVNALLTSFRRRVWSGGSVISIERRPLHAAEVEEVGLHPAALRGRAHRGVAEHLLAVGPPGEDVLVPLGERLDRRLGPHAVVVRVRVGPQLGRHEHRQSGGQRVAPAPSDPQCDRW